MKMANIDNFFDPMVSNHRPTNSKPAIMVVEDDDIYKSIFSSALAVEYKIILANNGLEGYEIARKDVPDIILADLIMPEMDGVTLCRKIKADPVTSHIPLIVITSREDAGSKLHGLASGADDYIYKSADFEEVRLKIRNWLERRRLLQRKTRLEMTTTPTKEALLSMDASFLVRLKDAVEKNISETWLSVRYLSREMGLSRVQLYRKTLALTGMSVSEYIRKCRLKRAAMLFDNKVGSVSQVAYEVGFNNLSYFAKCFKDEFRQAPSEYLNAVILLNNGLRQERPEPSVGSQVV